MTKKLNVDLQIKKIDDALMSSQSIKEAAKKIGISYQRLHKYLTDNGYRIGFVVKKR